MAKVSTILERKGKTVHTTSPETKVIDAVKLMVENRVGSLLVLEGTTICGIVTERDYLCEIALQGRTSRDTPVADIMTGHKEIVFVTPEIEIQEAMAIMTEKRIRHLPVLEDGELAGIVSVGDLIKQVSKDRKAQIQYLTDYIAGKYPG